MTLFFEVMHPKHYYQFKALINHYKKRGDKVIVIARNKDIVFSLLDEERVEYEVYGKYQKNLFMKFFSGFLTLIQYDRLIKKYKPDIILSKASPYSTLLSKIHASKTVIFPDSEVVALTNKLVSKIADIIVTPKYFTIDFGEKHARIDGFFEETYISPNNLKINTGIHDLLHIGKDEKYAILRFVSWNANHDIGKKGIDHQQLEELVSVLSKNMKVFITSEEELPERFKEFKLNIPLNEIHSALYYADLYIGDSQTMATEAALLGTPSIRCNDFVGDNDMSNFIYLEEQLALLKNFNNWNEAIKTIRSMIIDGKAKVEWRERRSQYFKNKQDINEQIEKIIESINV